MTATKRTRNFRVLKNIQLNPRHFILELQSPEEMPPIHPGQFVQVLVENSGKTFLRRPFSIHSTDSSSNTIRLMVQIKGDGTRKLSTLLPGQFLNMIYPLGNSFTLPDTGPVLLVGGGCGVAPLLMLARELNLKNIRPHILVGGRSRHDLLEIEEYRKAGDVLITTDDGSEGEKGLVTDHPVFREKKLDYKFIYCCGPDPMMQRVAKIAAYHDIPCQVSLENTMACGFGVCLCCVTPTLSGNQRVCMEGPVFDTRILGWDKQ
jgi:dihydroorotate dehydrogenase electron transfer subunit